MPSIQNVERRGAVYYWRRTVRLGGRNHITLRISLCTTDQAVARRMAAAMTAKSETLRMMLEGKAGFTIDQKADIFRKAMSSFRDQLDRSHIEFQRTDPEDAAFMIEGLIDIWETMLRDFIVHGLPANAGSPDHVEERFAGLSEDQRNSIIELFQRKPKLSEDLLGSAEDELDRVGAAKCDTSAAIARKVILEGKLAAALEFRRRMADPLSLFSSLPLAPSADPVIGMPSPSPAPQVVDEPWASMTPTQAAERFIAENPKVGGGQDGKRKARWTEKTKSQFLAAARLLEKSYGPKSLFRLTAQDVIVLNRHFDRLPASHHKSPRHQAMTLEEICQEAERDLAAKKISKDAIGLNVGTTNRHFGFLRELVRWFRKKVPVMAEIDWADFIFDDERDAREQRDAYTVEEGRAMFRLPIWIGSRTIEDRLTIGTEIWHDAAYWVLLIAWYTGLRREEICQLKLEDTGHEDGIWFFRIHGNVKTAASRRLVPFASELERLGLPSYVEALSSAGETMLFPELRSESGKQPYGDVFYKMWWAKIAAKLDFVKPGQALHSFRHMVATELKDQHVFEEDRADLIGHALPGETAGRYSKAARLAKLKDVVEQIPVVTDRLKAGRIRLLPPHRRAPRPARR